MRSKLKLSTILSFSVVILLLSGCASEDAKLRSKLKKDQSAGKYNTLYAESKDILANEEFYDPKTVQKAREYYEESKVRLTAHFSSNVRSSFISHDVRQAILGYEFIDDDLRSELEKDTELQERLARGYIEAGNFTKAKEAISNVRQYAAQSEQRSFADDFLEKTSQIDELNRSLTGLRSSIKNAADRYGFYVGGDGIPATHCSYTAQDEQIPEHVQKLITEYDNMAAEYYALKDELGKPASVQKQDS